MNEKKASVTLLFLGFIGFLTNGDIYSSAPLLVEISSDLNISLSKAALSVTSYMYRFTGLHIC